MSIVDDLTNAALGSEPAYTAQAIEDEFEARKLAFSQSVSDYHEVVETAPNYFVLPHIEQWVKTAKGGVRVLYHLAKHLDQLAAISELAPADAIMELRRLEIALEAATPKSPPRTWQSWVDWHVSEFERTAIPEEKRAAAHLAQLYAWEPITPAN